LAKTLQLSMEIYAVMLLKLIKTLPQQMLWLSIAIEQKVIQKILK